MSTRLISPLAMALIAWVLPASLCKAADLYVLSIGVEPTWTFNGERDLYAGDAVFVGEAFSKSEGLYAHTHRRVVSGKQATRDGVLEGLAWLGKSVGEDDLAIIFFSTHGSGDSEKGHEVTLYGDDGKYSALKSTEIWAALDAAKGRTVVLMDSCTSGGMAPPASQLEKREKRTAFFAGCTATEETGGQFQRADRPHGWFVIALCEALAGKADTDGDRVVTLGEVEKYLPCRAKQFYREQNASLVGSKEMRTLPLVRVDPAHPAVELFTAQKKEPGRNPFGESDVADPDGADVQAFAAKTKLEGGRDDPNAAAWLDENITGPADKIAGQWASRWNGGMRKAWIGGKAEIKMVGDRVYILYSEKYLFDLKRTGEKNDMLIGRYVNLSDTTDTSPWVGIIVGGDRIDGHWSEGRWDFRRTRQPK